jgi:hypothetical protein
VGSRLFPVPRQQVGLRLRREHLASIVTLTHIQWRGVARKPAVTLAEGQSVEGQSEQTTQLHRLRSDAHRLMKTSGRQAPYRLKGCILRAMAVGARLTILTCLPGRVGKADVADPP